MKAKVVFGDRCGVLFDTERCLGGIGFTMSLFIAALALGDGALLDMAKIGTWPARWRLE